MYRHKLKDHKNIKHPCNQCEYVATFSNTLRRHIKTVHGGNKIKNGKRKVSSPTVLVSEEKVGKLISMKEEVEVDNSADEFDASNSKMEDSTAERSRTSTGNFLSSEGESLPGGSNGGVGVNIKGNFVNFRCDNEILLCHSKYVVFHS